MKKTGIILLICLAVGNLVYAQNVGMNCQYFPALQVGRISVKATNNAQFSKYSYGAGVPLLMVDRITSRWYLNLDFSALYYAATQTNKANDNRIGISKAEGAYASTRIGYLFGEGDQFRIGPCGSIGMVTSNLDSLKKPFSQKAYFNYGLGVVAYKKFGKFRTAAKIGYELYAKKNYITKGHGMYFEGTIAYSFYQKYGISLMPCISSKKLTYVPAGGTIDSPANAKVFSFVVRLGLTKFF